MPYPHDVIPDEPRIDDEPKIEAVLGPLGSAIMRTVWDQQEATVRSVVVQLERETGRQHAYTTVMTILGRLNERGLLERTKSGRGFVYRPRADEAQLLTSMGERAVDHLLEQYGTAALRRFAHHVAGLDPSVRAELLELAEEPE